MGIDSSTRSVAMWRGVAGLLPESPRWKRSCSGPLASLPCPPSHSCSPPSNPVINNDRKPVMQYRYDVTRITRSYSVQPLTCEKLLHSLCHTNHLAVASSSTEGTEPRSDPSSQALNIRLAHLIKDENVTFPVEIKSDVVSEQSV